MKKRKAHHTKSPLIGLLIAIASTVSSIGAFVIILGDALAALVVSAGALIVKHWKQITITLLLVTVTTALIALYRMARTLPHPRTTAGVLSRTQITIHDRNEIVLYHVRDEDSYRASMNSLGSNAAAGGPTSVAAASRSIAATQMTSEENDPWRVLKREIIAARVRARFSKAQITGLYQITSFHPSAQLTYTRAPLATSYALSEAAKILGKRRFEKGGITIHTSIDLPLYNDLQQQLLTEVAQDALPSGQTIVTQAQDGAILSLNSIALPTARMESGDFDKNIRVITKIVASDGSLLYENNKFSNRKLSEGGDSYGI